eukprot:gene4804-4964_t
MSYPLCLLSLTWVINGAIISSSNLEQCLRTGVDEVFIPTSCPLSGWPGGHTQQIHKQPEDCDEKFVVTLTVDNGQWGSDQVQYFTSVSNETSEAVLEEPVKITLTKTKSTMRYPLRYVQDFNARPRESSSKLGLFQCMNGEAAPSDTCGWLKDSTTGGDIPYSLGYCCGCELDDFLFPPDSRGGADCSLLEAGSSHCVSAIPTAPRPPWGRQPACHLPLCLRMDGDWYQ